MKPHDIIYFKLRDSVVGSKWCVGKVEDIILSKDGKVRKIVVGYRYDTEQGERKFSVVERPVRECVKLFNIEDTGLFEDITAVRDASRKILGSNIVWYHANNCSPKLISTYSCNRASAMDFRTYCASDLGYVVLGSGDGDYGAASEVDCLRGEIEIGTASEENDMIFMINSNDNDTYDDNDNKICLL